MIGHREFQPDLVIVACAISAGIHAALVPEHLAEGLGAGLGFAAAAGLLGGVAVAVTLRPHGTVLLVASATALAGLIGSYALAVTTGVPVLHPEPEPVGGLAIVTKAVEAIGLLAAVRLLRRTRNATVPSLSFAKGLIP